MSQLTPPPPGNWQNLSDKLVALYLAPYMIYFSFTTKWLSKGWFQIQITHPITSKFRTNAFCALGAGNVSANDRENARRQPLPL